MSDGPVPGIEVVVRRRFYVGLAVLMTAFRFPLSRTDTWLEITTRMVESISSVLLPIL